MTDHATVNPKGVQQIAVHLVVRNSTEAVEFYKNAFGAEAVRVNKMPDGKVASAELRIGDSELTLGDEFADADSCRSPESLGGTSATIHIRTENVDKLFQRAVAAGAKVTLPLANQFWGERYGRVRDPFGHSWGLGQRIENVAAEEMERRVRTAFTR
jgi:PhnB protein